MTAPPPPPSGGRSARRQVTLVICCSTLPSSPSGGDVAAIRLAEQLSDVGDDVGLLTTPEAVSLYGWTLDRPRRVLLRERRLRSAVAMYLVRTIEALRVLHQEARSARGRRGWVVAASFYPPDLLPALLGRCLGFGLAVSWQLPVPNPLRLGYDGARRSPVELLRSNTDRVAFVRQLASYLAQGTALAAVSALGGVLIRPATPSAPLGRLQKRAVDHDYVADLPPDELDPARPFEQRSVDAIYVGRLHPQKGIPDLVEAWTAIARRSPRRLVVIGAGSEAETAALHELARSVADVRLLGTVTGRPKLEALTDAKVLLFPSHHESFGLVVDEALACGCVPVAYDLPCLQRRLGAWLPLAPAGDAGALARLALDLLDDPGRWSELQDRGLAYARTRTWDGAFERVVEVLGSRPR